jgi:hypothetical protein
MLRALVLLFLLVNAALYFWLQSDSSTLQSDREPQRLRRQVSPDSVQVLPDLPAASGAKGAASAAAPLSLAASGPLEALAGTPGASAPTLARKTSDTDVDCAETTGLDDAQFATLKTALTKGGVPADGIAERRESRGGAWIVYLGRFADAQAWQQKADELKKLDVKFDRVNTPASLAPGLSLGQFANQADATKKLDQLTKSGVQSARVVTLTPPTIVRHLQVRAIDPAWHHAAGAQRFNSCPLEGASSA